MGNVFRSFVILFMCMILKTTFSQPTTKPFEPTALPSESWCHFDETSVSFKFHEKETHLGIPTDWVDRLGNLGYVCLCLVFDNPREYRLIARFCNGYAQNVCSAATAATQVQPSNTATDFNLVTCDCSRVNMTHSNCECFKPFDGISGTANINYCTSTHVSPMPIVNSESRISQRVCWRSNYWTQPSHTRKPPTFIAELQFTICHETAPKTPVLCYQLSCHCQGDEMNPIINYCSIPRIDPDTQPDIPCTSNIFLDAKTDYTTNVTLPINLAERHSEDGYLQVTFNDSRVALLRGANQKFIHGLLPIGRTTIMAMVTDFTQNRVTCSFTINITRVCDDEQIACDNGLACIPNIYKCNGFADCRDQSDEDQDKCFVSVGDVCPSSPCLHGGTCIVTDDRSYRYQGYSYKCNCHKGYTGINCEYGEEDKCAMLGNVCIKGNCSFDTANGFACDCFPGWTGTGCDRRILDKCAMIENICKNGKCFFDEIHGFSCNCSPGWTGTGCDRPVETNSSGENSAQLSNVTTGLTGAGVVIIISLAVITIICLRYRHTADSGRSNSSTENKGAFTNTIYGDGERDSVIAVPIQSHAQIQSKKSEEYQGLSNRPKQDPYQDLKKIKARPNSYDDNNYIDPNEVNGRGSRRPTAPADDEAEYIDVDSEIQRAKPSYGTGNSKEGNATSNVDPDYFQLEKPPTNGDPVYFQLEKENIESAQGGDENLQDYDRLAAVAGANPPREGQKNTTGGDDTYQHLKSNVSPVADNDDYQHLKRDGF